MNTNSSFSQAVENARNRLTEAWTDVKEWAGGKARQAANAAGAAVKNVVQGVNNVAPNMLPTATATLAELSFRGTQGSFASLTRDIVLVEKFFNITGRSPSKFGYPACKSRPIMYLDGFCMTQNAMFEISGTVDEEQALEELFNKGVIIDWSGV